MKKTVELELCDICPFRPEETETLTATRKCEVCDRSICKKPTHIAHSYDGSSYMRRPFTRFVCGGCWELAVTNVGYVNGTHPLPKGNIDLRAGGNTGAINIAEFHEWVASQINDLAADAVIDVMREIKHGATVKFEAAEELRKIKEKHQQELTAVKEKVRSQYQ